MAEEKSITSAWLRRHSELFKSAVRSPFVLGIRDGSLDFRSFAHWLEQGYLFVKSFVRFVTSILAKIPTKTPGLVSDEEVETLLGGLNALKEELAWFRTQALKWNLRFDTTVVHESTQRYCKFLSQVSAPHIQYPAALSTLWILETVYNESFAICLEVDAKTAPELQEACQRFGNEEFRSYCMVLKVLTDRALEEASLGVRDRAEGLFVQVLLHEEEFFSISMHEHEHEQFH